jgi:hypothetical protein
VPVGHGPGASHSRERRALAASSSARVCIRTIQQLEPNEATVSEHPEQELALQQDLLALIKRVEVLEDRVTELEREIRETQEAALSD